MAQRGANRQRRSSAKGEFTPLSYMLWVINDVSAPNVITRPFLPSDTSRFAHEHEARRHPPRVFLERACFAAARHAIGPPPRTTRYVGGLPQAACDLFLA